MTVSPFNDLGILKKGDLNDGGGSEVPQSQDGSKVMSMILRELVKQSHTQLHPAHLKGRKHLKVTALWGNSDNQHHLKTARYGDKT